MKNRITARLSILALVLFGALGAWAQDAQVDAQAGTQSDTQASAPADTQASAQADTQASTPASTQESASPGVARVSLIHGDVSTQRGDSGDWAAAALNAPVMGGDKISTGDKSRAELQLDQANILRLSDQSRADIGTLTRTQIQVQIAQGLATYSVFKNSEAEPEIDTPNVAIHPARQDGSFRILVSPDGSETTVIVRKGEAEISTSQGSTRVKKGQVATIRGTGNDAQYKLSDAPGKDDWDRWISQRDDTIHNAQAWSRTNRNYVGSEDLDAYGSWTNVPDYGSVWVPTVTPGWAPYSSGRWVWQPYYGWTWVSYEPWGWAPYHYGRWMWYGNSWAWWPGPVYAGYYPAWGPAYVSFFGFGRGFGFGFGFGFGNIGWFPIGPCDRFRPWWGGWGRSYNVVNVNNINHYRVPIARGGMNPLHPGTRFSNLQMLGAHPQMQRAMSTLPSDKFGRGAGRATPATQEMLRNTHMINGAVPVVPTRESLSASGRPANVATLPRSGQTTHFFGRTPAAPESFAQQQTRLQQVLSRDSSQAAKQAGAGNRAGQGPSNTVQHGAPTPVTRGTDLVREPGAGPHNGGWTTFGQGPGQNKTAPPAPSPEPPVFKGNPQPPKPATPAVPESGWHRFSDHAPGGNLGQPAPVQTHPGNSYNPGVSPAPSPRPAEPPARNDGWQRFNQAPQAPAGSSVHSEWTRPPSPQPAPRVDNAPRGSGGPARTQPPSGGSRPPLEMRQPIVTPRPSGPSGAPHSAPPAPHGGSGGGGGHSAPSSSHSGGRH